MLEHVVYASSDSSSYFVLANRNNCTLPFFIFFIYYLYEQRRCYQSAFEYTEYFTAKTTYIRHYTAYNSCIRQIRNCENVLFCMDYAHCYNLLLSSLVTILRLFLLHIFLYTYFYMQDVIILTNNDFYYVYNSLQLVLCFLLLVTLL